MKYVKTTDLDRTFFNFIRIDNRNSIEQNGLVAVAGGENRAGNETLTYFIDIYNGIC